jgi:phage tail-like protein
MTSELLIGPTTNGASSNGYHPAEDAAIEMEPSAYLRYLPAVYQQDPFMGRFLRIFEDILSPVQKTVSRRAALFDPAETTATLLQFMATWVGADELGELPEAQMRLLVRQAVTLNQLRGTKRGLRLALEVTTGKRPYITEYSPGLVLGEDAVLGLNTSLQDGAPLRFHVLFKCYENEIDTSLAHAIIRRYKPAGAVYTLSFIT